MGVCDQRITTKLLTSFGNSSSPQTMAKLACLLLGIGLASAGVIFPVPDPYRWDESFTVEMPQIDDEHRGLFNGILLVERENNEENLKAATIKYHDHFTFEEGLFKQTMSDDYIEDHLGKHKAFLDRFDKWTSPVPEEELTWAKNWLVQHIKNTDFGYRGHLKHEVPEPYVWDASFSTDYKRLDEEHDVLFADILKVSQDPDSAANLDTLKKNMRLHFDYEQQRFCAVPSYNCVDHKMKHYKFWVILDDLQVPVDCEKINWAKIGWHSTSRTPTMLTRRG